MKYLFSILLLFGFVAANAQATYPMRRTNGNAIVTDVALTATEYFRLPTFNASVPNLGSYADSSGRILFNRFDSNLLVRNNGAYLFFQPSTKTVNLLGAQTIIGAKQFNAVTTFNSTTTFGGVATFNAAISAGAQINPAVDIQWANNSGFGLRGSDGVRYLSYTTALGAFMPTLRIAGTAIQNGNPQFTVQGKAFITDSLNGANANFTGTTRTSKIIGNSSTPSISGGSASFIGTGASTSIVGNDMAGTATLTTGTGCGSTGASNEAAFTVTFASAYTTAPIVLIQAVQRGGLTSTDGPVNNLFFLRRSNAGTTGFTVYIPVGTTLTDSTTYDIFYHVIGK